MQTALRLKLASARWTLSHGLPVSAIFTALLLFSSLFSGCSTTPTMSVAPAQAVSRTIKPGLSVLVLDPKVTFEDAATQTPILNRGLAETELRKRLLAAGFIAFSGAGGRVTGPAEFSSNPEAARLAVEVSAVSEQLLRGFPPADARAKLSALGAACGCEAVLVYRCQVKIGPNGSWDPFSGAITSAQNSAHLQAMLFVPGTREVLWQGDVMLRALPQGKRLDEAIRSLFANLSSNSEQKHK